MENHYKIAALYVASLKGIAIIHQHSHWITKGISFYGDHLLFERVYNSAIENADEAAEKFIGVFGEECLDYSLQNELLNKVLLKYNKFSGSPLAMSLAIEKDFLKLKALNKTDDDDSSVPSCSVPGRGAIPPRSVIWTFFILRKLPIGALVVSSNTCNPVFSFVMSTKKSFMKYKKYYHYLLVLYDFRLQKNLDTT